MTTKKSIPAKLLALCLALMLTVSMALTAAAAPITTDNQSGKITVQGLASDEDASVSLYKIIDIHFDADAQQPYEPVYVWNDAVADWVAQNYPAYIDGNNGNAVTKVFSTANAENLSKFYTALGAAANTLNLQAAGTDTLAAPDYAVDFTVEMGQYIVLATKAGSSFVPAAANLVPTYNEDASAWELNDVKVVLKGQGSSIDKNVQDKDDETVAIGDVVGYRLDALTPIYPDDAAAKRFVIGDTLSKGLTLDPSSIVVKVGGSDPANATTVVNTDNKYYTLTTKDDGFDIEFNYDALVADYQGAHTYVEYNATVNEFAFEKDALGNKSYVGVNTNPYDNSSYKTNPGDKDVYTYGVTVNKVDEKGQNLAGAEFKLYRDETLQNEIKFVKTTDGTYRVAKADETAADTLAVDSNGILNLQGLDLGTYYLKEVKAPNGYNLLQNAVVITLTDGDAEHAPDGVLDNEGASGNVLTGIKVVNSKGFNLPVTGGIGTVLFTVVGVVLMASGVLLVLFYRKKRQNSDQ